jgi:hypothetical protein
MTDGQNGIGNISNKIIRITDHFKTQHSPWIRSGIDALDSLSRAEQKAAIEFIINYVFMEVKVGLGLVDPIEGDEPDLPIFSKIDDIYEQAAGGCYFCSNLVDPHEDEFIPGKTSICPMCSKKLARMIKGIKTENDYKLVANPQIDMLKKN